MSSSGPSDDRHEDVAAWSQDQVENLLAENDRLRDALNSILTTVEDASAPYERLKIGALARAGLGEL